MQSQIATAARPRIPLHLSILSTALLLGSLAACTRDGRELVAPNSGSAPEATLANDGQPVGRVFSRFALVIDDARLDGRPGDAEHDAFLHDVFLARLYELGPVDQVQLFGTGSDDESHDLDAAQLSLATLMLYKHVIWSCDELPVTRRAGLWVNQRISGALQTYVERGGRLLIFGNDVAATLTGSAPNGSAIYPKAAPSNGYGAPAFPGYEPASFLYRDLGLRGDIVSIPTVGVPEQIAASGLVGAEPSLPGWPTLTLDLSKWDPSEMLDCEYGPEVCHLRGGIAGWEGTLAPFSESDPTEVLYGARTWNHAWSWQGQEVVPVSSTVDHAALVRRWTPPVANSLAAQRGRVAWMGFQPWYFEAAGVSALGRLLVNWLVTGNDAGVI